MAVTFEPQTKPQDTRSPRSCIAILGVPFDCVSMEDTSDLIEEMVHSRRPHYLATANVDFAVQALEDEELRRILFDAHLVVCDGTPLLWASRWLGNPLPERVAGSDLVPLIIRLAAKKGYRVYFLGGRPDVTARAVANLRSEFPALQIVGADSPAFAPLHEMDHAGIGARIRDARPDLLFVSFGCPKQEKWIAMNYRTLGVPVSVGVGATIDFLAGEVSRAPVWMQRAGLEWIYRLLQEPRRLFKRYVKDFWVFGRAFLRQWLLLRPRTTAPVEQTENAAIKTETLVLPACLDAAFVARSTSEWDMMPAAGAQLLANGSVVEFVDSTGVGALIRLHRRLRAQQGSLILVGASKPLLRALDLMKLTALFPSAADENTARVLAERLAGEATMPVRRQRQADAVSIAWDGEITAATLDRVWDQTAVKLDTLTDEDEEVLIDLSRVRFVDSSGLGFMVRTRRFARQQARRLRFVNPSETVLRVIRMARLEEFLLKEA
jgi:N-acetylglucosaminyldiphosphoundecaprenol N-acetyl-beta-D-mannosaminyltransferase